MTWRMNISHKTMYQYESPVVASFNEVRMTPASSLNQYLIHHELLVSPHARIQRFQDYWGTNVETFDLQTPHEILEVTSENLVEMSMPQAGDRSLTWKELGSEKVADEFYEYLQLTNLTDAIVDDFEHPKYPTPHDLVQDINEYVNQAITYLPGATNVHTSASEAWARESGVCQDFTHITISMLRRAGIPARYISGYLFDSDNPIGMSSVGESHSWVEAWVGEWMAIDPTNRRTVDQSHVVVAKGRDYSDVSPFIGIYSGGASRETSVEVTITRKS
jgi:transglutaminase-like putative cysteine protease